jgi:hypothetical protein
MTLSLTITGVGGVQPGETRIVVFEQEANGVVVGQPYNLQLCNPATATSARQHFTFYFRSHDTTVPELSANKDPCDVNGIPHLERTGGLQIRGTYRLHTQDSSTVATLFWKVRASLVNARKAELCAVEAAPYPPC